MRTKVKSFMGIGKKKSNGDYSSDTVIPLLLVGVANGELRQTPDKINVLWNSQIEVYL